jgi:phospholipid-translocating ATPase
LITPDSNIIIIRGGNDRGRTIRDQMLFAVGKYFPDNNASMVEISRQSAPGGEPFYPLERIETGISSIVGDHNGERPGGFVLVVDGTALLHVRFVNGARDPTDPTMLVGFRRGGE